jgi:pteridine reductase
MSDGAKSRIPTVLVTGAARRIGARIAEAFHARGCRVLVHYHGSREAAVALVASFNAERPDSACCLQADLTDPAGPERLAALVREQADRLDVLVNNASRFYPTAMGDVSPDDWRDLMGSNLRGPFFLTQSLLPELRAGGGAIVNILDIHAKRPMPNHPVYCMAKAGLAMMTQSLALELGPDIRVNGVAPGAILWPEQEPSEAAKRSILGKVPLKRLGEPGDIAGAVVYLALDAPYVTGQVLAVDGGRSMNV